MLLINPLFRYGTHSTLKSKSLLRNISKTSGRADLKIQSKRSLSTTPFPKPKSRHIFFKVGISIVLGGCILYKTNDAFYNTTRHIALTADRVGVVALATIRCFKLYKDTLAKEYDTETERSKALSETHLKAAKITLKALEKNGGIYIKLGQHITALTYLLPHEWTSTMIPLQDRCPRSSLEEIDNMFQTDLGVSMSDLFSEFNPEPVGVASLAQVHIATLKDSSERVAVKIQHPSLAEFVPLDVYMTQRVFRLMRMVFPEYPLTWLGDELQSSIYVELNFVNEAENSERTASYFKSFQKETALRIPKIVSANRRILIMEYVEGARLDDLAYMKKNKINTSDVSSCLSHIFNNMIFTPDVGLHCDPHGGNLAIRATKSHNGHNFQIILYDHGLYRQIPLEMKRDYSHFWLSLLDNDIPKMRKYTEKLTGIKGEQKFRIFASAITGRDPENALHYDISKERSADEILNMQSQLQDDNGVLEDLMDMLSTMPRVILLILKTNDLTRNLDEGLDNPLGPERTFLILANYCAKAVFDEAKEKINTEYQKFSIGWTFQNLKCWWAYQRRLSSLYIYDCVMMINNFKHKLGL